MTEKEFTEKLPFVLGWIEQTLAKYRGRARPVATLGFERLPLYFSAEILNYAKVVYVAEVPQPPLRTLGLGEFAELEDLDAKGITYLDTFFSRDEMREDEAHHFHELVHVIQWRLLGPEKFIAAYAEGLLRIAYRQTPLEVMVYTLEKVFRRGGGPFDVETVVRDELSGLYGPRS